jgi:hypothetical protein
VQDPNENLPGMSILRRPVETLPELPGFATLQHQETQEPDISTDTSSRDLLTSLFNSGFVLTPKVLASMALTIPLHTLMPMYQEPPAVEAGPRRPNLPETPVEPPAGASTL